MCLMIMYGFVIIWIFFLNLHDSTQYSLNGSPKNVISGEHITITLTCTATSDKFLRWRNNAGPFALISGITNSECNFSGIPNSNFSYGCISNNGTYIYRLSTNVTITPTFNTEVWFCVPIVGGGGANFTFDVSVPVKKVEITPRGDNNVIHILDGDNETFNCTTDASRPASWIRWYIGKQNVTNQAQPEIPQKQGDTFISSSILVYIGNDDDHNKSIHCEAGNIEERGKVNSTAKLLNILFPVTKVTFSPAGDNKVIDVVVGAKKTFTCTTDASRPAAWIQWYIGELNVTNKAQPQTPQQNGNKLTSSSILEYTGINADHNKTIYCLANNIEGRDLKVKTIDKYFYIQVPLTTVNITTAGSNNVIDVVEKKSKLFTCTTGASRPAGWIQWYIAGQNVTNQAKSRIQQQNDGNFISSSTLNYTGSNADHNKSIHCEAVNIDDSDKYKVKSTEKTIFVQIPVSNVTITSAGDNNIIDVVEGDITIFTCTTDASRPAAMIQWYIGGQNFTNQSNPELQNLMEDKSISSSVLSYRGNNSNHNEYIHCEAFNTEKQPKVNSRNITIEIKLPVTTVTIIPSGNNNMINVEEGKTQAFNCTTGASRPVAWIHWYIGGQNMTIHALPQTLKQIGEKFIASSIFNYKGLDLDHNKSVFCEAGNIVEKQPVRSLNKTLAIQFGPKNISFDSTETEYTVAETKSVGPIICLATCRPDCKFNWTGPNGLQSDSFTLQIGPVYRNQTGKYVCNARNAFGFLSSHAVDIIVNYSPSIVKLSVNSETVENQSAIFQCVVESHPASNITWTYNNHMLNTSSNVHQSNYIIPKTNCLQIGTYQCKAANIIDGEIQTTVKQIDFFVLCGVRRDKRKPFMADDIGINDDEPLNITEYLVAYPEPTIQWTFKNKSIESNDSLGTFLHNTSILKWQIGSNDFGVYTLNATNQIGEPYVKMYDVFPQRKPNAPSNITVNCDIISMKVFWRSESNGGDEQTFDVLWRNHISNETIYSRGIDDLGEGKYHSETTYSLNPNTLYDVFVEASNSHGTATSDEHMNCTTKKEHLEDSFVVGALVAGILGSICGCVVISAVIIILVRRTKYSKDDREPIRRKNKFEVADEDDDELKDNPLYMSSAQASGVDNGQLYSIVNKKSKTDKATHENIDQGPIYSQIQKPENKGRTGRKEKKTKKQDKNVQHGNGIELGSVYENSEPRSSTNQSDGELYANSTEKDSQSELSKNNYKPSKNKDGLIYADLDLAPGPTGKKFVIRGLENRSSYAIIDLTKTAEPLPSSDEDDAIEENK